ncbi:hypothetical protein CDD83_2369 [Cordyceps sp. RAO-2017]|nr:hypothetical protein CDD83_2369 [Cordyceps sp. RAO-2017]
MGRDVVVVRAWPHQHAAAVSEDGLSLSLPSGSERGSCQCGEERARERERERERETEMDRLGRSRARERGGTARRARLTRRRAEGWKQPTSCGGWLPWVSGEAERRQQLDEAGVSAASTAAGRTSRRRSQ